MVVRVVVVFLLLSDYGEDGLHDVEVVDPSHHHQELVHVVLRLVTVAGALLMDMQSQHLHTHAQIGRASCRERVSSPV